MAAAGYATYRNNQFEGMDPKRLILMLYEGAVKHLRLAREGLDSGNTQKRGENISRAIAIITELNACLDKKVDDESILFLSSLYVAILVELPKVAITKDGTIIDRAIRYISMLKEVWENEVMKNKKRPAETSGVRQSPAVYGKGGSAVGNTTISV